MWPVRAGRVIAWRSSRRAGRASGWTGGPAADGTGDPLPGAIHHDHPVRPHSHRRPRSRQPCRHGAADAQSRGTRASAVGPRSRVLPAARECGAHHHRGVADQPGGPGLHRHARHPQRGAGGGLAAGHRCRARRGRPHRHPAVARRARLARLPAAERPAAGVVDCAAGRCQDLPRHRLRPGVDAARAAHRRDPGRGRELSRRGAAARWRPASMASRCTARTVT